MIFGKAIIAIVALVFGASSVLSFVPGTELYSHFGDRWLFLSLFVLSGSFAWHFADVYERRVNIIIAVVGALLVLCTACSVVLSDAEAELFVKYELSKNRAMLWVGIAAFAFGEISYLKIRRTPNKAVDSMSADAPIESP